MPKDVASVPNVIVRMSKNAWVDKDLTSEWVDKIWEGAPSPENGFLCETSFSVTAHKRLRPSYSRATP